MGMRYRSEMLARILTKIPSIGSLLASKWFIGIAAAGLSAASIWLFMSGHQKGIQSGYDRAEKAYQDYIEESIVTTVTRRDDQWATVLNELRSTIEANARTDREETELLSSIERLEDRLDAALEEISSYGECRVTPEFDGLFEPYTKRQATP